MVATPNTNISQAGVFAITSPDITENLHLTNATVFVIANFPTPEIEVSQSGATVVAHRTSNKMNVSQAGVLVVARGRVYSPKLRAWPYTLDSHDYYVLRLGEGKTLVFDWATKEWSWFTSEDNEFWRPLIGMNWYSAGPLPAVYGSNVVAGDDTFGHLWILDPEQGYDNNAADVTDTSPVRFPRVATGQLTTRERRFLPIYQVYLTGSSGYPVEDGDTVEHSYSDDAGVTYVTAGELPVTDGSTTQEFAWRSLGLAIPSGRIFRISDDGAFARIDSLDVSYGGENE